jgi:hypothetical protein
MLSNSVSIFARPGRLPCRPARSAFANSAAISCFGKTTFAPYKALINLIGASSPLEYGPMLLATTHVSLCAARNGFRRSRQIKAR